MPKSKQKKKGAAIRPDTAERPTTYCAFFHQEGEEVDIRMFDMDDDTKTSFACLQKKLEDTFPKLKDNPFVVTWKNAQDYKVTIVNDDDLTLALQNMSGPIYNLYVNIRIKPKAPRRRTVLDWENIIKEQRQDVADQKDALIQQLIIERDGLRHTNDRLLQIVSFQQTSHHLNSLSLPPDVEELGLSGPPGTSSQTNPGGLERNGRVQLQLFLNSIINLYLQRYRGRKY